MEGLKDIFYLMERCRFRGKMVSWILHKNESIIRMPQLSVSQLTEVYCSRNFGADPKIRFTQISGRSGGPKSWLSCV